jgi:hypothetical protein
LVRVLDGATVVVPGWDPGQEVLLDMIEIPEEIKPLLVTGARLHATANLAATRAQELKLGEWERC